MGQKIGIGNKEYEIKPVKMKYIKQNFYADYLLIKKYGFLNLVSKFVDGETIIINFLKAVFDKEELPKELIDNLNSPILKEILEETKKINEIDDEQKKNEKRTPMMKE
ncbi:hypothetical protein BJV85_002875 [Clostridium acetobutylicum]|uniref:Uncharacterized protein n=1 Tax=Clostridium acetobutylicum (strain ATCC 824 / DSM 792 / JCM 1419 / IAM 19013 / LMG 5710 / NBRC 13948 / NRRL B-527 / VKM B-1787 / 2291 / W) TaxID=272562 RepID=Q97JZ9_CLOAB|nr:MULTISPECIES: hypothetical protein [Clostridium]AAK79096.1 Hypothetical protein CA_C1123 [Clostridium acetobutylicum ATCC 824]AEI31633.1 hypothetical protein SMB_G1142 [Clostridium acetobutylicum DSM 1731]AWV81650.1 hypothetical protein DK921_16440 [Clostridium acetobutylicum]MBC2393296.1 hypothetical protein [Clostridium acetobutylicum]MBC2585842.1 hypothetical protein [Clostridium acetobutylicum]